MRLHHIRRGRGRFLLPVLALAGGLLWARAAMAATTSTGLTCTITGDANANTLTGTAGDDVICGLGGNDTIDGGGGNDVIDGGSGNDVLTGGSGYDTLLGGAGNDTFNGGTETDTVSYADHTTAVTATIDGNANDGSSGEKDNVKTDVEVLQGSSAADKLTGGTGSDTLLGGSGNDTLTGGGGNDTLTGDAGADTLTGGTGTDTVSYATSTCAVTANLDGTANDGCTGEADKISTDTENITGGSGNDTLTGSTTANVLSGGAGNDTLSGGAGNDTLSGDAGNDTLAGGTGADVLNGGADLDTASYADQTGAITADIDGVADDGLAAEGDNVQTATENITGGSGNDTLTGSTGDNTLTGGGGNDTLSGGDGTDTLNGGAGTDTLSGGAGTDTLNGDAGIDTLNGGADADTLNGGTEADTLNGDAGNDTLSGGAGSDTFNGGTETDTATYADQSCNLSLSLDATANDGCAGEGDSLQGTVENLTGGTGNDSLTGDGSANVLAGGDGTDTLSGSAGADTLSGGNGTDTATYADQSCSLSLSLDATANDGCAAEGDSIQGTVENLTGGTGSDTLTGDGSANLLSGGDGNDTLSGGAGSDTLSGGNGADRLGGDAGADTLDGGPAVDVCQEVEGDVIEKSCEQSVAYAVGMAALISFNLSREDGRPLVITNGSHLLRAASSGSSVGMYWNWPLNSQLAAFVKIGESYSFDFTFQGLEMAEVTVSGDLGVLAGSESFDLVIPAMNEVSIVPLNDEGVPVPGARVSAGRQYEEGEGYSQSYPCQTLMVPQASNEFCTVFVAQSVDTNAEGRATIWLPAAPSEFRLRVSGAFDFAGQSAFFLRYYNVNGPTTHTVSGDEAGIVHIRGSIARSDGVSVPDLIASDPSAGTLDGAYGIYSGPWRGFIEPTATFSKSTRTYDVSVPEGYPYSLQFWPRMSGIAGLGSGLLQTGAEFSNLVSDTTIDLKLLPGYPVSVQVLDLDGTSVPAARIYMRVYTGLDCFALSANQKYCAFFGEEYTTTDSSGLAEIWSTTTPTRASAVQATFTRDGTTYQTGFVEFTVPGQSLVTVQYCASTDYWNMCP